MRRYLINYTYTGDFADTYNILVEAENYGTVERNIKKVFLEGVEMTRGEAKEIINNEWYYVIALDDEEPYVLKEGE